jgi:hypothetical protein
LALKQRGRKPPQEVKNMDKLRFFITEYEDGNLEIETKHIHYTFRDDLNFDYFEPGRLYEIINKITETLRKENIIPYFIKR